MADDTLQTLASMMTSHHLKMATAESCTGGWIAKSITDLAGSSDWFDLAVVSYSNDAKQHMLGVKESTLEAHGAVSEQVVCEMVIGVLGRSNADLAVAVSGIAGPGGGSLAKPVGTVWFAWAKRDALPIAVEQRFDGDREAVRQQAVEFALQGCLPLIA